MPTIRNINIFVLIIFSGFQLFGQVNEIDTVQWLIFDKKPNQIIVIDDKAQIKPVRCLNLKVNELTSISSSNTSVKFFDNINNKEILIYRSAFQSDKHSYDFEKNLIDGKISFGNDGIHSKEYVDNNFFSELTGIKLIDKITKAEINFVNSSFPITIHPLLTNQKGDCVVKLFWFEKYFKYLIILIGGGGGAGSYENYFLIDMYDRIWIFAKDIITDTVFFVPISNQKDPFAKYGNKNWYYIILK